MLSFYTALLLGGTLVLISSLAYFQSIHWAFELLSTLRLQYFFLSCLFLFFVGLTPQRSVLWVIAFIALTLNALPLAYLFIKEPAFKNAFLSKSPSRLEKISNGQSLRLLQLNLYYKNANIVDVSNYLTHSGADVIALQEVTPLWKDAIEEDRILCRTYPYRSYNRWGTSRGRIALLSKYPISPENLYKHYSTRLHPFVMVSQVLVNTQPLTLINFHPPHPTTLLQATLQKWLIRRLVEQRQTLDKRTVVMGDYNTTPWSGQYQHLKNGLALHSVSPVAEFRPTWPSNDIANRFAWFLQIPIDHILVTQDIHIQQSKIGRDVGSDHLPVLADIVF